jgi:hypothetical protein
VRTDRNEGGSQLTVIVKFSAPLALAIITSCLLPAAGWAADDSGKITAAVDGASGR